MKDAVSIRHDALAAAIDWLDAYRAGDVEAILRLFAADAIIECGCNGLASINGSVALKAYWVQRVADFPATELADLQPVEDGAIVAYVSRDRVVRATLSIDADGKISVQRCGRPSTIDTGCQ